MPRSMLTDSILILNSNKILPTSVTGKADNSATATPAKSNLKLT